MSEREAGLIYCLVPRELAPELHEALRKHFREDPSVEVVVERRMVERRAAADRRGATEEAAPAPARARAGAPARERNPAADRRRIRNAQGRRVADRRVSVVSVDFPPLPRKARPHADELRFIERVVPTDEQEEDLDTARLVTRIQAGDREGYAELYLRFFDRVYSYARVLIKDRHEAEDLTQQVFVKVLEGLPKYERRRQPFRAWLFIIVRNTLLTELRKRNRFDVTEPAEIDRQRERMHEPEENGGGLGALEWITDRELLLFVERLPLPQRQVLLLRFMLDLPASETAQIVGRTPDDVRKLQHRALRFLEERLTAVGRTSRDARRIPWLRRYSQMRVLRERRFALH
jgi:RNA polymerase sigma-70 factor (ECF subfamily)